MRYLILSLMIVSASVAETVSIPLRDGYVPVSGYGLVITDEGIKLTSSSPVSIDSANNAVLSLNLPEGSKNFAGIISDVNQNVVSSPLKSTGKAVLPLCKVQIDQSSAAGNQTALLQSLIQIRVEKRDLLKKRVLETLDPSLLEKLNKLEEAFGLAPDTPLTAELDPYTLSERLSLLAVVLGNLEEQRQ